MLQFLGLQRVKLAWATENNNKRSDGMFSEIIWQKEILCWNYDDILYISNNFHYTSLKWYSQNILEEEMTAHSRILAWKIPWTEEPGRLQPMELQRVRYDWAKHIFQAI